MAMSDWTSVFSRIFWKNKRAGNTPLNETNLNTMDIAMKEFDDRILALRDAKFNTADAQLLIKSISYNETNGVFTVTYNNGTTTTIDTNLEKLVVNFDYDSSTQKLIITLDDGTTKEVDLSALITQYEFTNSSTIGWTIADDGKVTAKVVDGSIGETQINPDYMTSITTAKNNAENYANLSKSYAIGNGGREGESTDNAKYYAEQAKESAESVSIATSDHVGLVKPDGETCEVDETGTLTVTSTGDENLAFKQSEVEQAIADGRIVDGDIFDVTDDDVPQAWTSTQIEHTTSSGSKTSVGAELINLNSNLDELSNHEFPSDGINIEQYNSITNYYTCPSDGYVRTVGGTITIVAKNGVNYYPLIICTSSTERGSIYVRKGTKVYVATNGAFIPFIS